MGSLVAGLSEMQSTIKVYGEVNRLLFYDVFLS